MALYYASVDDRATVFCFLYRQEMRESPIKTQNPVTDLLVALHPAQSASLKALNWRELFAERNNPCPVLDFKYLRRCVATCI